MRYADFVDYSTLDPFKRRVIETLEPTLSKTERLGVRVVAESLGEPAALLDFMDDDFMLAFKSDGVGTKGCIADDMVRAGWEGDVADLYSGLGVDLIAMNANDLICVGATPLVLSDEIGSGRSEWFADEARVAGLLQGLRRGCDEAGITIPCGETPTLPDVINPDTANITGSMIGIVRPKERARWGQALECGDVIFGLASSGIHSNGLTLTRRIAERLPQGYFTPFTTPGDHWTLGQELLTPTRIYVQPVLEMFEAGVELHYLSNISGSGWRKVMRCRYPFTYVIERLPEPPPIFRFLQERGEVSDYEAYQTWNMGMGFCLYAPEGEAEAIEGICAEHGISVMRLGHVEEGKKRVMMRPLRIAYSHL
ncbi:MAG: AIR synthase-related protein [Chloroflexota bacterium]|nr:AIR synthase-related protein [Chloroflexota bacterium]